MPTLYAEDVFPKGKHQGKKVSLVVKEDPNYVRKFNTFYDDICISDETIKTTYSR